VKYARKYKDGFAAYIETENVYTSQGCLESSATAGVTVSSTYDVMGRPLTVTDGRGYTTELDYDDKGNVSKVTHTDENYITYDRDYTLNTLTVTDELGNVVTSGKR